MNRTVTLVFASALLAGCAGGAWHNTRGSNADMQQDLAQCEYEAVKATSGYYGRSGTAAGIEQGFNHARVRGACMSAKGYVWR